MLYAEQGRTDGHLPWDRPSSRSLFGSSEQPEQWGFAANLCVFQTLLAPLSRFVGKVADQLSASVSWSAN